MASKNTVIRKALSEEYDKQKHERKKTMRILLVLVVIAAIAAAFLIANAFR